ncbi:hypothetical protein [Streptomyces sp. P17]|uniref:hypothetical protein n=1 Tax=Streptomyces sp. P17 TaxID=3074716 RepID=UPI0028F43A04|nr:hypothetical protein [Streptomyces sp. P17]MDT9698286.1 hypothetical protein [Streptomyces sp. P17]
MKNKHLRKLAVPATVNLLLGIPAIVPLFLVWYFMVNGPLAAIGWTQQDPNENDGMLLWLVFVVPAVCLFGLIWGFTNAWLRRRTALPASWYWPVCAAAPLVPFFVLFIPF